MADSRPDKADLTHKLTAAFLSHRVEELTKSVLEKQNKGAPKFRDRRGSRGGARPNYQRGGGPPRGDGPRGRYGADREQNGEYGGRDRPAGERVADVVVVDASVLVHALDQLKAWCGKGREEVVVIPLEALNTLDTLKKGASSGQIVRRGREASRYLEGQVGTNPRIRIQSDNEFVPWDSIPFSKDGQDASIDAARSLSECPDWLRRTVCCARWEYDHFPAGNRTSSPVHPESAAAKEPSASLPPKVVIAVCFEGAQPPDTAAASELPFVRQLPRHEQRCAGRLVAHWAEAAGIPVVKFEAPMRRAETHTPGNVRSLSSEGPKSKGAGPPASKGPVVYGPGRSAARDGDEMVQRPPVVIMMKNHKPGDIHLLARGEKLEP
ncbi:hypothetical protein M0805_009024 [Coniferiporia weirii]|nr:hypothetical protein M0805_009024 [Coniferiporia weirii]